MLQSIWALAHTQICWVWKYRAYYVVMEESHEFDWTQHGLEALATNWDNLLAPGGPLKERRGSWGPSAWGKGTEAASVKQQRGREAVGGPMCFLKRPASSNISPRGQAGGDGSNSTSREVNSGVPRKVQDQKEGCPPSNEVSAPLTRRKVG